MQNQNSHKNQRKKSWKWKKEEIMPAATANEPNSGRIAHRKSSILVFLQCRQFSKQFYPSFATLLFNLFTFVEVIWLKWMGKEWAKKNESFLVFILYLAFRRFFFHIIIEAKNITIISIRLFFLRFIFLREFHSIHFAGFIF